MNENHDTVSFVVRVTPRASRTRFIGMVEDGADAVFRIALAAPPVEGRANAALVSYLSDLLNVARSAIEVISGEHTRNKVVRVRGRTRMQVESAFKPDKKA
ncbi:MAG TPA: DUF167 domain-containing protein [Silvibacterium sp.]|nr:DUF167 domain-containing protein [Silvibacterium sp.]